VNGTPNSRLMCAVFCGVSWISEVDLRRAFVAGGYSSRNSSSLHAVDMISNGLYNLWNVNHAVVNQYEWMCYDGCRRCFITEVQGAFYYSRLSVRGYGKHSENVGSISVRW
jgi:hypothetical protein